MLAANNHPQPTVVAVRPEPSRPQPGSTLASSPLAGRTLAGGAEPVTAETLAAMLGITPRAVAKRAGIDAYIRGRVGGVGRPRVVYDPSAVELWGMAAPTVPQPQARQRRQRSDRGAPRVCSPAEWHAIVVAVCGYYLASGQPNLRLACEQAVGAMAQVGTPAPLTAAQIYKRLTTKALCDGVYTSEFYRDGWEVQHRSIWRKKDHALGLPKRRWDWQALWEDAGWAGRGFGALRGWSIDVRMADAWTRRADGAMTLPAAVYIRDCLSGMPLWVEPIESETAEAIIRAVLKTMLAWGRSPDICVVIDNGAAMIAERTLGVLRSMLPAVAFDRAASIPELFPAASPILHNLPNIPTSPYKAELERSFRLIKDEYDATRHALTYQGGSRQEGVQLRVSHRATHEYLPDSVIQTVGSYFGGLGDWMYSDYVNRPRPAMFPTFVRRGAAPTIGSVFAYYYDPTPALPVGEQIAHLLYWASPRRTVVQASMGYVDATIDTQAWHVVSSRLDHTCFRHRIAVLPIPGTDFAVLMLADDPSHPVYLDTARNAWVRSLDDLRAVTPVVRQAQRDVRAAVRAARESVPPQQWANRTEQGIRPELAHGALERAGLNPTPDDVAPETSAVVDGAAVVVETVPHGTLPHGTLSAAITGGTDDNDADIDRLLDDDDVW